MSKTIRTNLPSICNNFVFSSVMKDQHGIRTDVYAKDVHGNSYDIEMQCRNTGDLPLRSRYYHSMMDNYILNPGESYGNLKHSMVIFICTFDVFQKNQSVYITKYQCLNHPDVKLDDKAATIYLNIKGLRKDLSEELVALLDYFETETPSSDLTNQMQDSVTRLSQDKDWRHNYMTIGQELEMEKKEAFKDGVEHGIEQGIEQGAKQQLLKQISLKLSKGKSVEQIAEEVEESVEYIQSLVELME